MSRTHGPGSLRPPMSRPSRRTHDDPAWLGVEFHFLRKLRLIQQRLRDPNATGIADANDARRSGHSDYIVITSLESDNLWGSAA